MNRLSDAGSIPAWSIRDSKKDSCNSCPFCVPFKGGSNWKKGKIELCSLKN